MEHTAVMGPTCDSGKETPGTTIVMAFALAAASRAPMIVGSKGIVSSCQISNKLSDLAHAFARTSNLSYIFVTWGKRDAAITRMLFAKLNIRKVTVPKQSTAPAMTPQSNHLRLKKHS